VGACDDGTEPVSGNSRFRVGMDSGGTFTDIVVLDMEAAQWKLYKILSQRENPAAVLHAALDKASTGEEITVEEFVEQTEMMVIGTTVATNALLQHRGAKTGLLGTRGHTDVLEIREGHKEDGHRYDWDYPQATMLVPSSLRIPITERVFADGSERTPIAVAEVEEAAQWFREEGVESIALAFLWSFLDPSHEEAAVKALEERLPGVRVSASHELLPMIGYYNRTSTVVLNAYLQPVVAQFVEGIDAALEAVGFTGPVRYFQANGGMSSGNALVRKAIYALNSGPAAAPTAGSAFSRMYGKDVITIDAGGTSLDVGLVRGGRTDTSLTSDVARYRIGIPMVNIETLGAGGGSIAWFDSRGILSVGPQSAESRPGPACYGLGGIEPTVTDALVALGWFSQKALLGGEMPIDPQAAVDAIETKICEPAGLSLGEAAEGIIRVVTNNMVGGIRRVSVERGYDPRDAVLVAVGGCGPAFGCRIAEDLEMDTVVVPRVASGFCAFGAALSEVKQDYVSTQTVALEALELTRFNELLGSMEARGRLELEKDGVAQDTIEIRRSFEMRYADQVHNCLVNLEFGAALEDEDIPRLRAAFDARHEELYTYSEPENVAMLINIHVSVVGNATSKGERKVFTPALGDTRAGDADTIREVFLGSRNARVPAAVVGVDEVAAASHGIPGPAVVEETTTTIVVPEGWTAFLDIRGHYEIRRDR
jgi:N-methylhydantoinase A